MVCVLCDIAYAQLEWNVVWMPSHTGHKSEVSHPYVNAYESASNWVSWMPFHTYHTQMASRRYGDVDVSSEKRCLLLTFHICHKRILPHQYVNAGGIWAYSCVGNSCHKSHTENACCDGQDHVSANGRSDSVLTKTLSRRPHRDVSVQCALSDALATLCCCKSLSYKCHNEI